MVLRRSAGVSSARPPGKSGVIACRRARSAYIQTDVQRSREAASTLAQEHPHGRKGFRNAGAASGHNFAARSCNIQAVAVTRDDDGNLTVSVRIDQTRVATAVMSALVGGRPAAWQRPDALRDFEELSSCQFQRGTRLQG